MIPWSGGQQVTDLFDRFAEAESLSGAVVEFGGDRVQFGLRMHGQVGALREVLAQKAVGVLIRPALPGLVRVAEEDVDNRWLVWLF